MEGWGNPRHVRIVHYLCRVQSDAGLVLVLVLVALMPPDGQTRVPLTLLPSGWWDALGPTASKVLQLDKISPPPIFVKVGGGYNSIDAIGWAGSWIQCSQRTVKSMVLLLGLICSNPKSNISLAETDSW